MKLKPCSLCWYQRVFLYPILIICVVSFLKKTQNIIDYVKWFYGIGFLLSLYQYILQMTSTKSLFCKLDEDCSGIDFIYFGFITIPFLSLLAFLLMFSLSFLVKIEDSNQAES
ncbi:disulfide bond formation protein B [Bacillus swezeyi]|uniref:Disulfide bond formation protein B n=2 Tax=Bacillus swezeyi TaxID=1925020 RepID=A0A5M8S0Y0_9BACI|nr:disulfide bond formation protein B [Bacillus swezeyi]KAA6472290.1 disulfide bond formation protein B [Bacillus swezeyi]